jgi:hypothetical protein
MAKLMAVVMRAKQLARKRRAEGNMSGIEGDCDEKTREKCKKQSRKEEKRIEGAKCAASTTQRCHSE